MVDMTSRFEPVGLMQHPRFFGFGSLVNCATHDYPAPEPARLRGWRRLWIPTGPRDIVALSIHAVEGATIEGLTADVPDGDWAALDAREKGYTRQIVTPEIAQETRETWVYSVPENDFSRAGRIILQSYLDVVLQGFLRQSGETGLRQFFETTDGWDIPVFDDRDDPRYVRHQAVDAKTRALFDDMRRAFTGPA